MHGQHSMSYSGLKVTKPLVKTGNTNTSQTMASSKLRKKKIIQKHVKNFFENYGSTNNERSTFHEFWRF